ncbi:hypothetical protein [Tahibacter soli]|uniref:Dolichyl-phosphate-mannose-protein mannosyltransferase n=1 Tax=Tahibacter soli TaxID=2983605 RepID=A0A9X4BJ46_9GAMM|nr:hypothetical protein [Tahibacter soli]MDC8014263.1 hypothetical protein [Tahibacter soli]
MNAPGALKPGGRGFLVALLLIVLATALFRRESMSHDYYQTDESIPVAVAEHMARTGTLDTNWSRTAIGDEFGRDQYNFSSYILGVYAASQLLPHGVEPGRPTEKILRLYRKASLLFGVLALALAGLLARRWLGPAQGLIATLAMATSIPLFQDSLYARPETFVTLLSLMFAATLTSGRLRPLPMVIASGVLLGLLIACKITFVALLPLPLMLVVARMAALPEYPARGYLAIPAFFGAVGASFATGAPWAVQRPWEYLHGVAFLLRQYTGGHPPHGYAAGDTLERFLYGLRYLVETHGVALLPLAAIGLVALARERAHARLLVIVSFLAFLAYFLQTRAFFERNFSHALPFVFMAAAHGIVVATRPLARPALRAAVVVAFAALLCAPGARLVAKTRFDVLDGRFERRVAAHEAALEQRYGVRLHRLGHFWAQPAHAARTLAESFDDALLFGFINHRTPGSQAILDAFRDKLGLTELEPVPGPYAGMVTSTLHTYFGDDHVYYLRARRDGGGDIRLYRVALPAVASNGQVPVDAQGAWTPSGVETDARAKLPPGLVVWGSWSGADANTGTLTLGPQPFDGRLLLPYTCGPVGDGLRLSFRLLHADGSETKRDIALSQCTEWSAIDLRANARPGDRIEVVARDDGAAWGQWLGIALPLQVTGEAASR